MHRLSIIWITLILSLTGCTPNDPDKNELTIFAAASLADCLPEIAATFTDTHDCTLTYNFASSGTLAQQIRAAPIADILISADSNWIHQLTKTQNIDPKSTQPLLQNQLVIVTHHKHPAAPATPITEIDFQHFAIGNPDFVPLGRYTQNWLQQQSLWQALQTSIIPTIDARATAALITSDQQTIGIIYLSDYHARKDQLKRIQKIPLSETPDLHYQAAITQHSKNTKLATAFIKFLKQPASQKAFQNKGFQPIHTTN